MNETQLQQIDEEIKRNRFKKKIDQRNAVFFYLNIHLSY